MLACGLGENSRVVRKITGRRCSFDQLLEAEVIDRLSILVWQKTKDAQKGRNKPKLLAERLLGRTVEREVAGYETAEEFEAQWARILEE